jgi:hypothetical protein
LCYPGIRSVLLGYVTELSDYASVRAPFYFLMVSKEGSMRNLARLEATELAGVGQVDAQVKKAREAASEAMARARSADAELDDSGDNVEDHEQAAKAHIEAASSHRAVSEALHSLGEFDDRMKHDSAAARHSAAAAAHRYACDLGQSSGSDPLEDGSGMELGAEATRLALMSSKRAADATSRAIAPVQSVT